MVVMMMKVMVVVIMMVCVGYDGDDGGSDEYGDDVGNKGGDGYSDSLWYLNYILHKTTM